MIGMDFGGLESTGRWCYTTGVKITAVLEPQRGGGYTAFIPALPGCVSEGDTVREAKRNLLDALRGYLSVANKKSLSLAKSREAKTIALRV